LLNDNHLFFRVLQALRLGHFQSAQLRVGDSDIPNHEFSRLLNCLRCSVVNMLHDKEDMTTQS
jgi:hypothetical protein